VADIHRLLQGFKLGEWIVKPDDGSLASPQRKLRLEPLLMELLVFLCSNEGRVVPKQEVLQSVWRNRFVSDDTVKASFYQLRKALGDTSHNSRFIETVPKRGYRLLVKPVVLSQSDEPPILSNNVDALYRKGRSLLSKQPNVATLKQARLYFERASEIQPDHAESMAALASTYIHLVAIAFTPGSELLPRAKALSERAVQINPRLAGAYLTLGITQLLYDRNLAAAENSFRTVTQLEPNEAEAYQWCAKLLSAMGRHDEALSASKSALRVDPLSLMARRGLIEVLLAARRYDETVEEANRFLGMAPHSPEIHLGLAWVYFLKGDQRKAFLSVREGLRLLGTAPAVLGEAENAFDRGGMLTVFEWWAKLLEKQVALGQQSIDLLVLYALMGEHDKCLEQLHLAATQFHEVVLWAPTSPLFDSVRSDTRYEAFIRQLGFAG
jgi:DNA-binding winged helix-turn-helix (wHTH) protein/Flp pilus assembly protein TadD